MYTDNEQGVKVEADDGKVVVDVEMIDSPAVDDEDGDEGEGEGDDDDEADGNESGTPAETEDQDMKDAPSLPIPSSLMEPALTSTATVPEPSGPNLALAPPTLDVDASRIEGSPLKNVIPRSPKEPSPHVSSKPPALESEQSLPQVAGEPTLDLQPSPLESRELTPPQPLSEPVADIADDAKLEEPKDEKLEDEAPALPEPEETPGVVAITSAQEPESLPAPPSEEPAIPPVALEQPPVVEEPLQVPTSVADIPVPTREEPMPGQIPEAEPEPQKVQTEAVEVGEAPQTEPEVLAKNEQPVEEAVKAEEDTPKPVEEVIQPSEEATKQADAPEVADATEAADVMMEDSDAVPTPAVPETVEAPPIEQSTAEARVPSPPAAPAVASHEQAPAEGGTDEGFNILGSLSDSLNRQAEEDQPAATAAAPSEVGAAPVENEPAAEEGKPATEGNVDAGQ